MTRLRILIYSSLLLAFTVLSAEIIEIQSIEEILPYVDHETLLILDIDNTLIEPVQTLGSDQWFRHRQHTLLEQGLSTHEALEQALRDWRAVQHLTKMQTVETATSEIIFDLQKNGFHVMGLTTRGLGMSALTVQQLNTVGINLMVTAPFKEDFFFMNIRGVLHHDGILFTAATHKGKALEQFLKHTGLRPKRIIFVNDKLSHILPVAQTCEEINIAFLGLRYGYLDQKVAEFSKETAKIQWENFGRILSDEEVQMQLTEVP